MGARDLIADLSGAGLSVTVEGHRLVVRPASKLTDSIRAALREAKPELLQLLRGDRPNLLDREAANECHAAGWSGAEIVRFEARAQLLQRRGISEQEAEDLAERLTLRDREGDDRALCLECRHYRNGRCGNQGRAGLGSADVGRTFTATLQRCPGSQPER